MTKKAIRIPEKKKEEVKKLKELFKQYSVIGIIDITGLSSGLFQKLRKLLRNDVYIYLTKKRLIKLAIDGSDVKGLDKIKEYLQGIPVLVFAKENSFRIAKLFDKNKSSAPAKPGQITLKDIIIPAGPTPFAPGPIIGELGAIGLKTEVKDGKLVVRSDTVVAKKGEEIKQKVAEVLVRLGIEPMEIGLSLVAAFENGIIYLKDVLSIDDKKTWNDLIQAAQESMNLSVYVGFITKDNTELLLRKAALESNVIEPLIKLDEIKEKLTENVKEKKEEPKPKLKPEIKEELKTEEKPVEIIEKESKKETERKLEPKENIIEEVIEKITKGVEDKPVEPQQGPTSEEIEKTNQFVKNLIDGKVKKGDKVDEVRLPPKKKEETKKDKEKEKKEEEEFRKAEKIAQDILKNV